MRRHQPDPEVMDDERTRIHGNPRDGYQIRETVLWEDKKRPIFGLPLSFTKYRLHPERLSRETGVFSLQEEEVRIYRIVDVSLNQTVFQLMFNVGDITLRSSDRTHPVFKIRSVKNPKLVMRMIMNKAEDERTRMHIGYMDMMDAGVTSV